ncbi:patatin-like phospholipase family protein [Methylocystis sp. WRRC1]|uniref:patatin-like phospholipase family protein n=1 Tax=Methylocystis sp. WRRC1 TaxID=1732014 RepID=UPI001D157357|nr:patatin-like phospholipase family protein [Methylocystis sp. WRRC1]MCC3244000.1 patatin-like phospholipase family protein [Methylocystis sp. WRRC1]
MSDARTAFVLAGGGSLGAVQVGMLRALLASGVRPDFIVGSSVGAMNACYFAGRPDADGVETLAGIWNGLRRSDVFPFTFSTALALLRRSDYLVDPSALRRLIETWLPFDRLEEATIPVYLVATDMQGIAAQLSQGPAAEAILASAAVPGIFPTVEIDGVALMDGAVAANTPLSLATKLGATRVIILPTGYACALEKPPSGAVARGLHAITLLIAWQLIRDLEHLPETVNAHLAPALCPLNVSPYDFTQSRLLISRATAATQKWIESGGLTRRASPLDLRPHRHH